jgi:hypothetical protein
MYSCGVFMCVCVGEINEQQKERGKRKGGERSRGTVRMNGPRNAPLLHQSCCTFLQFSLAGYVSKRARQCLCASQLSLR